MDDTLAEVSAQLQQQHYVILDNFVPAAQTAALVQEVRRAHERGLLHPGGLAGGRAGQATSYSMTAVRGDYAGCVAVAAVASRPTPAHRARLRHSACAAGDVATQVVRRHGGVSGLASAPVVPQEGVHARFPPRRRCRNPCLCHRRRRRQRRRTRWWPSWALWHRRWRA